MLLAACRSDSHCPQCSCERRLGCAASCVTAAPHTQCNHFSPLSHPLHSLITNRSVKSEKQMSHPFAIFSHLDVLVKVTGDEIFFSPACCKLLLSPLLPPPPPSFLEEPDADHGKVAARTMGREEGVESCRLA